ncbi:MAG: hypothetical protein IJM57_01555 [Lachnospiraceae bacterium]|nr:hypothetical protein [Lachnospiraceae bacterium]
MKLFCAFFMAEMLNFAGINVYRYTTNPSDRKRRKALMWTVGVLIVIAIAYLAGMAYGYERFGIGRITPMAFPLIAVVVVFVVGALRAGGCLYRTKDRELLASLPVGSLPIAAARLAKMYVIGALITAVVLIPPFVCYGICHNPGILFWVCIPAEVLILPILPVALSAWVGIVFCAIIARMRHKVLAEVLIALVLVFGMFLVTSQFSAGSFSVSISELTHGEDGAELSKEQMNERIAEKAKEAISKLEETVPALTTWRSFFSGEKPVGLLLFGLASLVLLGLTALAIGHNLFAITGRLAPVAYHREYKLSELQSSSMTEALVRKEAKRYFASGVYVTNTILGPFFVVAIAIALLFFDPASVLSKLGNLPIAMNPTAAVPFLLAVPFCMMSITASSVSMEGKNWWIVKSLPIASKDVWNAKILFNLLVFAPFYAASEVILLFADARFGVAGRLWVMAVPLVYAAFSAVFGLFLNIRFPKFCWETETEVVKQSAAVGLSLLAVFAAILPGAAVLIVPEAYSSLATAAIVVVLCFVTALLYKTICAVELRNLGD